MSDAKELGRHFCSEVHTVEVTARVKDGSKPTTEQEVREQLYNRMDVIWFRHIVLLFPDMDLLSLTNKACCREMREYCSEDTKASFTPSRDPGSLNGFVFLSLFAASAMQALITPSCVRERRVSMGLYCTVHVRRSKEGRCTF